MSEPVIYCMDTSALLHAWSRDYVFDAFPPVWQAVAGLISVGRMIVPEMVLEELERHDDGMAAWLKQYPDAIVDMDEFQERKTKAILKVYPKLMLNRQGRKAADPFVIALASLRQATLVTGEAGGRENAPKIPYVCDCMGVPHIEFREIIIRERWRFGG